MNSDDYGVDKRTGLALVVLDAKDATALGAFWEGLPLGRMTPAEAKDRLAEVASVLADFREKLELSEKSAALALPSALDDPGTAQLRTRVVDGWAGGAVKLRVSIADLESFRSMVTDALEAYQRRRPDVT
ncbi:MAG TPA: hypothetical protein VGL46_09160 [Pseudonocardiaceae bacterium]